MIAMVLTFLLAGMLNMQPATDSLARPTDEELAEAPHHLFGSVSLKDHMTTVAYKEQVTPILADIQTHEERRNHAGEALRPISDAQQPDERRDEGVARTPRRVRWGRRGLVRAWPARRVRAAAPDHRSPIPGRRGASRVCPALCRAVRSKAVISAYARRRTGTRRHRQPLCHAGGAW